MNRNYATLTLFLFLSFTLLACSESNSEAPGAGQVHLQNFMLDHASEANADVASCKSCHGSELSGRTFAISCLTCHPGGEPITLHAVSYSDPADHGAAALSSGQEACFGCHGSAPYMFDGGILADPALFNFTNVSCSAAGCHSDAGAHPTRWQGSNDNTSGHQASHRTVSQTTVSDSCAMCHQVTVSAPQPRNDAPSCFTATFTNSDGSTTGCHAGGPAASHDMPYDSADLHGPTAKADLAACQSCHGSTGTTRFDGGSSNISCADCHIYAGAHPTAWQGSNDVTSDYTSTHRNAGQQSTACAICHDVVQGNPSPNADAPSCFTATFTNGDGTTTGCHAGGPTAGHDMPYDSADLHGLTAKADLAACQACHGTTGTTRFDGGTSNISCADCHGDAGAHPTRWQGSNDNTSDYDATHRNAGQQSTACAICHDVVQGNSSPNANAPSCFTATFTNSDGSTTGCHAGGPTAAHVLPFTDPLLHGPDAKGNLASCVPCHATPANAGAGDNPRFNVAIGNLAAGCEDCHAANTAHPTPLWAGSAATSHESAGQMATACALCHGTDLDGSAGGGVATACADCHTAGSPLTLNNCTSCHNSPPDGQSPAGDQFPNRDGAHAVHNALAGVNGNCAVCHQGAGTEAAAHYDGTADVSLASTYNAQSGPASYNSGGQTCGTTRCHGGQTTFSWRGNDTIDVDSDCESCHTIRGNQYNSPASGDHNDHDHYSCTECHDPSLLRGQHFSNLATTGFEQDPADTLRGTVDYNGSSCGDPRTASGSRCHGSESW